MDLKDLLENIKDYEGKEITIEGWIKNHRDGKTFGFIDFSDGTCFNHLQIVYDDTLKNFNEIKTFLVGSAIKVKGTIVKSSGKQDYELKAQSVTLLGSCPEDYPIQPKRHTREFLREQAYLRPRTNLFQAVFRIRSVAAFAIHTYFQERGYVYLHAPLITASDCEGAGEMFQVTTLPLEKLDKTKEIDYSKDFFGTKTGLTVSGQLESETFALAYKKYFWSYFPGRKFQYQNSCRGILDD